MKSTNDSSLLSPASRGGRRLALPKHHSLRFTGITSCARKVHEPRKNGTRRSGVPAERLPTDARAREAEQGTATAPGTRLQRPGSARQERKNLSAKAAGVSLPAGSIALETKTLPKKITQMFSLRVKTRLWPPGSVRNILLANRCLELPLLTRRLHDALQDDDDLELLRLHAPLREVVEGALGIYHVADGERRDEEELVGPRAEAHVQLQLVERQELALRGLAGLERQRGESRESSQGSSQQPPASPQSEGPPTLPNNDQHPPNTGFSDRVLTSLSFRPT